MIPPRSRHERASGWLQPAVARSSPAATLLQARACSQAGRAPPGGSLRSGRRLLLELGQARMRTGDFAHADGVLTEALEAAAAAG